MPDDTSFSASDSALGYLFQCRFALLHALRKIRTDDDEFFASLETADDVVFERQGHPTELLQLKHHVKHSANLTDASVDLWKTLRVWCEGYSSGAIDKTSIHYLVTTSRVSDGTSPFYLMGDGRNEDYAAQRLLSVARTAGNEANRKAYGAFLHLNEEERKSLLRRVVVIDASPNIAEVMDSVRREVWWAVPSNHLDSFVQRLEGWWFRRVVQHLIGGDDAIAGQEINAEMSDLREQFKEDNLPIDVLDLEIEHTAFLGEQFVNQLRLIDVGNPRIRIAIREYFRAFEQRSRWVREDLLHVGELGKYETKLVEEWEILFQRMKEDLGPDAADAEKKKAARALYQWVESEANFPIRPRCGEPFVTRGTYHILANGSTPRVGWHPEFLAKLMDLLESETG